MKRTFNLFFISLMMIIFLVSTGCTNISGNNSSENNSNNTSDTTSDEQTQPSETLTASSTDWYFVAYSLKNYESKSVTISFSADMKVVNNGTKTETLMWQVNTSDYPVIAQHDFAVGTTDFITVSGSNTDPISLGSDNVLYLSTYNTDTANLTIDIKNVKYTVSYKTSTTTNTVNWLDASVPSLKDTYKDNFDYFGLACEYNATWHNVVELYKDDVCKGLQKHASSITMGNEFKPESIMYNFGKYAWSTPTLVDFPASNGKTIKVPASLSFSDVDGSLSQCKKYGLKMRGHVLVWHSQTPDNFFAENYKATTSDNLISNIVDKDTMTARQEWYIKSVLEHIAKWEKENNNGEHIVWAWDVVNEAMADDADSSNWLRGSTSNTKDKTPSNGGSRWYQIYESDEFIVNAFRFANAYAPADVKLCYNDYNEYMGQKHTACLKIIDEIKNGKAETVNGASVKPRIDVMGMQSHMSTTWPGVSTYENAVKNFLDKGVDVHVTELDFSAETSADSANAYKNFFTLFQKYGNGNSYSSNKIECVTVWGINNTTSWIYKDSVKYPILFDNFIPTDSFWAVINAHKE